jgi:hypothetical protein
MLQGFSPVLQALVLMCQGQSSASSGTFGHVPNLLLKPVSRVFERGSVQVSTGYGNGTSCVSGKTAVDARRLVTVYTV